MVELLRISYTRLVEVRLLHHYWLDDGATVFDEIADDALRTRRLLAYDVRRLLAVQPSPTTTAVVTGLRGVFRMTGLGFVVAVPADVVIPLDVRFEFFVTVVAPDYAAYTAQPLTRAGFDVPALAPQRVADVVDPTPDPVTGTRRVIRYKANVPVLSNLTGVSSTLGGRTVHFLSSDYRGADPDDVVEALFVAGDQVRQRTGEPPDAPSHVIGARAQRPVYVHQGDVPAITPPAGSTGAPGYGIELTPETPPAVAAVIRIAPRRTSGGTAFDIARADGTPRPRVFEVRLQNRWTTWRYRKKSDGSTTSIEADPLPLTHFGNAGTAHKPSPAAVGAELDTGTPPKITRLVSDVYV